MSRLDDQTAVVTGASTGIGRAIAVELAARGARVVLVSRTAADLQEAAEAIRREGGYAEGVAADVTDPVAVTSAVESAQTTFGPVTLAVHCAGTAEVVGPFWESEVESWWSEVAGHAKGAATLARAVLPEMMTRGSGRIVNTYGNLGDRGDGYTTAYACGKAAMLRFTENVNAETRDHGVYVFAFHPGLVETRMTQRIAEDEEMRRWVPRSAEAWPRHWRTPDAAAALVASIAAGELDAYAGRLVGAWENLAGIDVPDDPEARALRVEMS